MSRHRQAPEAASDGPSTGRRTWPVVAGILALGLAAAVGVVIYHVTGSDSSSSSTGGSGAGPSAPKAQLTDPALAATIVAAAKADVTTIASYDYRTLAADVAAASAVVTGDYAKNYANSLPTTRSAATKNHTVQKFAAQAAGIGAIAADGATASAMVYGLETVTSTKNSTPSVSALVVGVTVLKVSGRWRVSVLQQGVGPITTPPGTAELTDAAVAARTEVVQLLTNSRSGFETGYDRGVAGSTGALRTELLAQQASVLSGLTSGGYDSSGQVVGLAVESASGATAVLLVAAQTNDVSSAGVLVQQSSPRVRVTMTNVNGYWLASALTALPAQ